jgi:hypothetical protein
MLTNIFYFIKKPPYKSGFFKTQAEALKVCGVMIAC